MQYLELRKSVAGLLRGDNSKAEELLIADDTYLKMAIRDVCMRTIPKRLISKWDETQTNVFRRIYSTLEEDLELRYSHHYIRLPIVSIADDAEVDMDEELTQALIFFMCSYISNKKDTNYVKSAETIINLYDSTAVDIEQYSL
jgi:hypothetical protein